MRAYRRLQGGPISNVALTTIVCPAATRWQLRELIVTNTNPAGPAYAVMQHANAAGTVVLGMLYAPVGPAPASVDWDLHLIVEAGEQVALFASAAGIFTMLNGIVYAPA